MGADGDFLRRSQGRGLYRLQSLNLMITVSVMKVMMISPDELIHVIVPSTLGDQTAEGAGRGSNESLGKARIGVQLGTSANFCRWAEGKGANTVFRLMGALWLLMW